MKMSMKTLLIVSVSVLLTAGLAYGQNNPPELGLIGDKTIDENVVLFFPVLGLDADSIQPVLSMSSPDLPPEAVLVQDGGSAGTKIATFVWKPTYLEAGVYAATFYAIDTAVVPNDTASETIQIIVNDMNGPPVFVAQADTVAMRGLLLTLGVSAIDPDGDFLTFSASGLPTGAAFVDNGDGTATFTWTADTTNLGDYPVTFFVNDGPRWDTLDVVISVNFINGPPVLASIGNRIIDEEVNLSFTVSATDPDNTTPILFMVSVMPADSLALPLPGSATFNDTTGLFTWTPDSTMAGHPDTAMAGFYTATFFARDDSLVIDSEVVLFTVNQVNQPPILDSIGPKVVNIVDTLGFTMRVIDADTDFGDTASLTASALPPGASFSDNGRGIGTFLWVPDSNQAGVYNITFTATDDSLATDDEVVRILVNRPPVLAAVGDKTTSENTNLTFAISSTDGDGETPVLTMSSFYLPTNSFVDNGDGTGTFSWTPLYNDIGSHTVIFYSMDSTLGLDSEAITITVNNVSSGPPAITPIPAQSVAEMEQLTFAVSALDPDGDAIILTAAGLPGGSQFNDFGSGIGSFIWVPTYTDSGQYTVNFIASAGLEVDTETVVITINNVNRPPAVAAIGNKTVDHGNQLSFAVSSPDPDGDPVTIVVSSSNLPGAAVFTDNGDGTADLVWNTTTDDAGIYFATIRATDPMAASDSETITITVTGFPIWDLLPDTITITEAVDVVSLALSAADPDGDFPLLIVDTTAPASAVLTDNGDGTGSFDFTPNYNDSGTYNLVFMAIDQVPTPDDTSFAYILLRVLNNNRLPVIDPIADQSVSEGQTLVFAVSAADADGDTPVFSTATLPQGATFNDNGNGTGTFTWQPDFSTRDIFDQVVTFFATDNVPIDSTQDPITGNYIHIFGFDTVSALIHVTRIPNDPPLLDSIGMKTVVVENLLTFAVSASDVNGTIPGLYAKNLPEGATFADAGNGNGTFNWTPDSSQAATYKVTFVAHDDVSVDSEVVTIIVAGATNQAPVLASVGDKSVAENSQLSFSISATDPDNTVPVLTSSGLPPGATLTDNGDGTAQFDWTPGYNQGGDYAVTFYASDGVAVDSETIQISVTETGNLPPVVSYDGPFTIDENSPLTLTIFGTDPEGDDVTISVSYEDSTDTSLTLPIGASFDDHGDGTGTFQWLPNFCQAGSYILRVEVTDGDTLTTDLPVVTVLEAGDQLPILDPVAETHIVKEGVLLKIDITTTLIPACDTPAVGTDILPLLAQFTDSGDGTGTFLWTPGFTQSGSYKVKFFADDGVLDSDSQEVVVIVQDAGNQPPAFSYVRHDGVNLPFFDSLIVDTIDVVAGEPFSITVSGTDPDSTVPHVGAQTTGADTLPTGASFIDNDNGTGMFSWMPDTNQTGFYALDFTAFDDTLGVDTGLTIVPVVVNVLPARGIVRIVSVDGLYGSDTIVTCEPITFNFEIVNNTGLAATFFDHGFSIESPNDTPAVWTKTTWDTAGTPLTFDFIEQSIPIGFGIDTVRFRGRSIPAGQENTVVWSITIGPIGSAHAGKQIRIDTVVSWIWLQGFFPKYPKWEGPYTYTIFDPFSNQAPAFTTTASNTSITECSELKIDFAAVDPDGATPFFEIVELDTLGEAIDTLPEGMTLVDSGDGTGTLVWRPTGIQAGAHDFALMTTDGCGADTQLITITVIAGSHAEINDIADITVATCEAFTLNIVGTGVGTLQAVSAPTGSAFTDNGDGTGVFTWLPSGDQVGVDTIDFLLIDPVCGLLDLESVVFTVINGPAITQIDTLTVAACDTLPINIVTAAIDISTLTMSLDDAECGGLLVDSGNGIALFIFTPVGSDTGFCSVVVVADDSCGGVDTMTFVIEVTPNALPALTLTSIVGADTSFVNDTVVYARGDTAIVTVVAPDPEGIVSSLWVDDTLMTGASFDTSNGVGVLTFFTDQNLKGAYTIVFHAADNCGEAQTAIVLIDQDLLEDQVSVFSNNDVGLPDRFDLKQNYPNPFNPYTSIRFDIASRTYVQLDIFNVLGQRIRNLVDEVLPRSSYHVEWDGTSDRGYKVATGIYFYRLQTAEYRSTRKMVLIK